MISDRIRNNLSKMSNDKRDYVRAEDSRLGTVDQRSTRYRRNGMLNFSGRQMINIADDDQSYTVGVGGPPVVS